VYANRTLAGVRPFTPEFRDMTCLGWESSFAKVDELLASGIA